jgi:AcrR family transcriptional regulator
LATSTGEGRRTRKKQRTRELIAETALRLFIDRGFDAATIGEIARAADVDSKTIYNYFPSKPDLVYHRLEEFEAGLLDAVRERRQGESILAAFARFAVSSQSSGFLGDRRASDQLHAVTKMIVGSETLLAHEQRVFARFTASLAELIREETGVRADDIQPNVAAHALIGFHRSLVEYVRGATLARTPNAAVARGVRLQAKRALATLEHGLGDYGVKDA